MSPRIKTTPAYSSDHDLIATGFLPTGYTRKRHLDQLLLHRINKEARRPRANGENPPPAVRLG